MCADSSFARLPLGAAPTASATYIGRVGALAVALGVGSAILGMTGVAVADTGDPAGSAGQESSGAGNAVHAASKPKSANRRGAGRAAAAVPSNNATAQDATSRTARQARRAGSARPSAAVDNTTPAPTADAPAAAVAQDPVQAVTAVVPDAGPELLSAPAPEAAAAVEVSPAGGVADNSSVPQASIVPIAEQAPVMTVAEPGTLAEGAIDPSAVLGGDGTGAPGTEPLVWAAAAVTRREDLGGAMTEVAPAAAVGTSEPVGAAAVGARQVYVDSFSVPSAVPGTEITITGRGFTGTYGNVNTVYFGCESQSACNTGVAVKVAPTSATQITVVVPSDAVTGYVEVNAVGYPLVTAGYSTTAFTVLPPAGAPTIGSFSPTQNLLIGTPVTITGTNFEGTTAVKFNGVAATYDVVSDTEITAQVPNGAISGNVTSGRIQVVNALGTATSAPYSNPGCINTNWCGLVTNNQSTIANQIAAQLKLQFPNTSVLPPATATEIGNGVATILVGLMNGITAPQGVAADITALATNADVLTFVSKAVAEKFGKLPDPVANTIGNAAASVLLNSLGNSAVALAFVPVLQALNLPTTFGPGTAFVSAIGLDGKGLYKAILSSGTGNNYRALNPTEMLAALTDGFFGAAGVQAQLGVAVTGAVRQLLGLGPSYIGAQDVPPTAVADYLGHVAASKLLGASVDDTNPLAIKIAIAAQELFDGIGGIVATSAGDAFATFLQQPAVPGRNSVAGTLATTFVNGLVVYLQKQAPEAVNPPFPDQPPLLPALAPGAGVAVTAFVNSLLSPPNLQPVTQGLGQFVSEIVPDVLGDVQYQAVLADKISATLAVAIGGDLGQLVGDQVGGAIAGLLGNPAVSGALVNLVNTTLGVLLNSNGVGAAVADAAGVLTNDYLSGETLADAQAQALASLKANADFVAAVGPSVTAGTAQFLSDTALWSAVDTTVNALVVELLGDTAIQDALNQYVAAKVSTALGGGALGDAVGAHVGATAVALVTNSTVDLAVKNLFDTLVGDFWRSPGVVTAYSDAAGTLATAYVVGNLSTVLPTVEAGLRANPDVVAAVDNSVGTAVAQLLGDTALWQTLNSELTSLVDGLLTDPVVQGAVYSQVYDQVNTALKGGPLGAVVGDQVATTVVGLMTNATVQSAVHDLVDTVITDFVGSPGVVGAYTDAADEVMLAAVTGGNVQTAIADAGAALRANMQVQTAVENSVGAAVTQLFQNTALWQVLNTSLTSLVDEVLADQVVQDAVYSRIYDQIYTKLDGTQLGQVVGDGIATAVVSLMTNSVVQSAVHDLTDTVIVDFFTAPGVEAAYSTAAGEVALVAFTGGDVKQAIADQQASLQANPQVDDAVQASVGTAVAGLLGNQALWQVVDGTLTATVDGLLDNPTVQSAVEDYVATKVADQIGGPLGVAVGAQVASTVVSLMDNTVVQSSLHDLVDTVFQDFFGYYGVVPAFSEAAGDVALVAFTGGDVNAAIAAAKAGLQANPAVDNAVQYSVGAAVTQLLTNQALWQVVNGELTSLVDGLLDDQAVQAGVYTKVYDQIYVALDGTQLGQVVGDQVAGAVVSLMTNSTVQSAVHDLTDTVIVDFFTSPGVVEAYSNAAGDVALAAFTGGDVQTAIAQAQAGLQANPDVDAAVQGSVGDAVAGLLNNQALWQVVDSTFTATVDSLLDNTTVQTAAYDYVFTKVSGTIGGQLGAAVGAQVANTVVSLMTNSVVQSAAHDLVDTLAQDFFGYFGVVPVISQAAGDVALVAFTGGDVQQAITDAKAALAVNPYVDGAVQVSVTAAVAQLLGDQPLWQVVNSELTTMVGNLIADPIVQANVGGLVAEMASEAVGGGALGAAVGPQVGAAVVSLMTNPTVQAAVNGLVDTVVVDFFGSPGVVDAVSNAVGDVAVVAVTGGDVLTAIAEAAASLAADPEVESAVQSSVGTAVTEFAGDSALWSVVGDTAGSLVTDLVGDPVVQQSAGAKVGALVSDYLGASPIAAPVGQAVGAAVADLLAAPGMAAGLGTVVASVLPDFFDQPGVPDEIGTVAGQFAFDLVTGESLADAQKAAKEALMASPEIEAALRTTIADALDLVDTAILSVATIQQALGSIVSTTVFDLATDPVVQAYVGQTYGQPVANLLENTSVVNEIATVLGSTVTDLLGYPGFSTALTDSAYVFANGVLDGQSTGTAVQDALQFLFADPAYVSGVNALIPSAVDTLLADPALRQAVGVLAQQEVVLQMQGAGINSKFLQKVAGQVVGGTVQNFLGRRAAANLLSDVTVNVATGMPISEVEPYVVNAILHKPGLQMALGFSLGQGMGSLFGDNIVGKSIGLVLGFPATITIALAAGLINIYNWLSGGPALRGGSRYFQPMPAASDHYVVNAIVPEDQQAAGYLDAVLGGQFALTGLGLTDPASLDLTMSVDTGAGDEQAPEPLLVAFRFRLDQLIEALDPATFAAAQAPAAQPVA